MPSDGSLLRIVSMMMGMDGWRDPVSNKARLQLAQEVLSWAKEVAQAHLVVFPAGYLCAVTLAEARKLAEGVMALARQRSVAVVLGVDICATKGLTKGSGKTGSEDTNLLVEQGQLPFFLFAWSPKLPSTMEWRQRSTSSSDWKVADPSKRGDRRLLEVNGQWVDVLACGEGFNRELRTSIEQEPKKTTTVVIAAHTSRRSRIWNATKHFASSSGLPTLLSVHQLGVQHGELRLPDSAKYAHPETYESFGSPPLLHAGVFTVHPHA